ncbi:hypothetical protein C1646_154225 [Rhizophagus diaphanus]|nr:hypothetical protein C1646_154225 [Rhizophagus diaphanus] [Rhizophagus sp. MUCL 43196]
MFLFLFFYQSMGLYLDIFRLRCIISVIIYIGLEFLPPKFFFFVIKGFFSFSEYIYVKIIIVFKGVIKGKFIISSSYPLSKKNKVLQYIVYFI